MLIWSGVTNFFMNMKKGPWLNRCTDLLSNAISYHWLSWANSSNPFIELGLLEYCRLNFMKSYFVNTILKSFCYISFRWSPTDLRRDWWILVKLWEEVVNIWFFFPGKTEHFYWLRTKELCREASAVSFKFFFIFLSISSIFLDFSQQLLNFSLDFLSSF